MKRMVHRTLSKIIIIGMFLTLLANYFFQIKLSQHDMDSSSKVLFWQINQLLSENNIELKNVKQDFKTSCLVRAKAAAYIVQNQPEILNNLEEMRKIAKLLQIDELHVFNTDGVIYTGSEPKYYGYHFHSGKQMEFFLPMLKDKSLEMCQEVTPNTAEGKLMQYAAVWRDDKKGIVQIGMEPSRIVKATKKNELSYIFSLLTEEKGNDIYAADPDTYEILGSTDTEFVGKTLFDIGISKNQITSRSKKFHTKINGVLSYCNFKEQNGVLVGKICTTNALYQGLNRGSALLLFYMTILATVMILTISRYLDKNIIHGIDSINKKLQNITNGDLSERILVCTTPEFQELGNHINDMVSSLLSTTDKLSSVLDMVQTPIGIYEYRRDSNRVRITSKIPEILALSEEDKNRLLADCTLFEEKLVEIQNCPINKENTIFRLPGASRRYIKIDSYDRENSIFGILMDVTEDVNEKERIRRERDEDFLTGLYNRRAFYSRTEFLFQNPDFLKYAAFVAIDTDRLKSVNDTYGHEAGDCYLCGMAGILHSCTAPSKIAARLSGDEFELLIYGCETNEELLRYIAEIENKQNGVVSVSLKDGLEIPVHFSVGCSYYPKDGKDYIHLLKCADTRMYKKKRQKHTKRDR